jgi:hypothetical protein
MGWQSSSYGIDGPGGPAWISTSVAFPRLRGRDEDHRLGKKLYVGNLPFTASEGEIKELFERHGPVEKVSVITDRETGRPRGFAFVEMREGADADNAIQALDGRDFGGRSLRVNEAQDRRGGGGGGGGGAHAFEANKTFGVGIELGEPTGLTGKYFFSDKAAIDFGLGWIYGHYYYGNGAHLYADFLYHPISLVSTDAFELPLFIGVGFRFWDFDYCYRDLCGYHDSAFGIRIPFGIAFDFNNAPIDIFLQLVPVIDFVGDDYYNRYGDRNHAGIDASVGFRFWFK